MQDRNRKPRWRAALFALALMLASQAQARPFQIEDIVRHESLGKTVLTPDEHWLVFARRAPAGEGRRFDLGEFNADLRTTLMAVDLTSDEPARPLFPHDADHGYRAGPLSPDGRRIAVWRVGARNLELGVSTLGTGEVRWFGVTTVAPGGESPVVWRGPDELIAIALGGDDVPDGLFMRQAAQSTLPGLWAATAKGDVSVLAIGSGRDLGLRPPPAQRTLVQIDVASGETRPLARGEFTDLELSPSRRWLAILEAGPEIPLSDTRPPQGPYGLATREARLRLLDLRSGALTTPCGDCDMLATLLSWSNDDRLLVLARRPVQPWPDGRLAVVSPTAGRLSFLDTALQPLVTGRPERAWATWWGRDPLVFGRLPGAPRDDWHRLIRQRAIRLTGELRAPPRSGLVVTPEGPLLAADDAAWRLTPDGRAQRLTRAPFALEPPPRNGIPTRAEMSLRSAGALEGRLSGDGAARLVRLTAGGSEVGPAAAGDTLAAGRTGAAFLVPDSGQGERLIWRPRTGQDRFLAELNRHLADIEHPAAEPIHHRGPKGERLTSWLYLPPGATRAPPLVIVPYPGYSHPAAPPPWSGDVMDPTPVLLGHGYAVLVPSLPSARDPTGPAKDLAQRLLAIVDAAAGDPALGPRFDARRMALWGFSFGAWGNLIIASQTSRFSAVVAIAGRYNLTSAYGQFTPWRRLRPQDGPSTSWSAGWTEILQADMRAPPWVVPDRYLANSGVFQAGRIRTPVMLVTGELDGSHLGQAEEMFSALYRRGQDATLVTYWGEGHALSSPGNLRDLYGRGLRFLDTHLGGPSEGSLVQETSDATANRP